jgi:hypothetical protein
MGRGWKWGNVFCVATHTYNQRGCILHRVGFIFSRANLLVAATCGFFVLLCMFRVQKNPRERSIHTSLFRKQQTCFSIIHNTYIYVQFVQLNSVNFRVGFYETNSNRWHAVWTAKHILYISMTDQLKIKINMHPWNKLKYISTGICKYRGKLLIVIVSI